MKKSVIVIIILLLMLPIVISKEILHDVSREKIEVILEKVRTSYSEHYVYGVTGKEVSIKNNEVTYYHSDHLGSNSLTTDFSGFKKEDSKYLPFGENLQESDSRFTYTGKEKDKSSLMYYGARYYDADIGRFTTVDPIKDGLNHYVYVSNNPLKYVDPSGSQYGETTKARLEHVGLSLSSSSDILDFDSLQQSYGFEESQINLLEEEPTSFLEEISGTIDNIESGIEYATSYALIVETTLHEISHAAALKSLGVSIHEFCIIPNPKEGYSGYVVPDPDSYYENIGHSGIKNAYVDIAPYAFDILIQHRVYETLYHNGVINEGSIIDSYIKTTTYLDLGNAFGSLDGDIASFSENLGINKYLAATLLTGLYSYSIKRVFDETEELPDGLLFIGTSFEF